MAVVRDRLSAAGDQAGRGRLLARPADAQRRRLGAGDRQKLRACDIFILLVSRHSLSSDYIVDKEIALIRERQAKGEDVHFYPLVLTPTPKVALDLVRDWQIFPRDGKAFSDFSLNDREQQMSYAADEIANVAAQIAARKAKIGIEPTDFGSAELRPDPAHLNLAGSSPHVSSDAAPVPPTVDGISGFSPDNTAGSDVPDVLGIDADARALARLMCLEGASPLAIAVLGGWGSGKSTFMERLDRGVRQTVRPKASAEEPADPREARVVERVVQIRFNAWQFVDANLWASLTAEFFDQLRAGGWDRQKDARYAGLVERVNRHVHALNADLEAKRKIASESAKRAVEAQKSRDNAASEAKHAEGLALGQSVLDELRTLYDSQRANLTALGLAIVGDDTTKSVDAVVEAVKASSSFGSQAKLIAKMVWKDPRRRIAAVAFAFLLAVLVVSIWAVSERFGVLALLTAILSGIGAAGTLAAGLLPALKFVLSVSRRGAKIAQNVEKANQEATKKLLQSEIKLREAIEETQAQEAAAEDASKRLGRYVDPLSAANPPRLLRYVLEDDPDTQALESQLGMIGRTRRLFQAVDDIVRNERKKEQHERADDVPDRVIIYIDDLDRCSEDQVYNVLQAIHLLLAFELFVVVVGVDIARVQTAVAKFAEGLGQKAHDERSQQTLAAQYLDKIFQIAFWLSPLTTGDDGSYARYVELLTKPASGDGSGGQTTTQVSSGGVNTTESTRPSGTQTTATPSAKANVDELSSSASRHRGLMTITLEPEEVKFLASDAIGRFAATTPRSVKRLVNCYRLVRTRLGENGVSIMGGGGRPPLYPLIGLMVAIETGQPPEVAAEFYHGLIAEELNGFFEYCSKYALHPAWKGAFHFRGVRECFFLRNFGYWEHHKHRRVATNRKNCSKVLV